MRKWIVILLAVVFTLGVTGMALAIHSGSAGTSAPPKPSANGNAVWEYIKALNPYNRWDRWPGTDKMYEGTQPHGAFLTTYVTDDIYQTIRLKRGPLPDGAMIVKENYTADKKLASITVMYKVDDYNPEAGDWFWAKYTPDGSIDAAGKVGACINCHSQRADNDYLFTGEVQ